jgi:hypothetical protein
MLSVVIIIQKKDENVNGSWQFCGPFLAIFREKFGKGGKRRQKPLPASDSFLFRIFLRVAPLVFPVIE